MIKVIICSSMDELLFHVLPNGDRQFGEADNLDQVYIQTSIPKCSIMINFMYDGTSMLHSEKRCLISEYFNSNANLCRLYREKKGS